MEILSTFKCIILPLTLIRNVSNHKDGQYIENVHF